MPEEYYEEDEAAALTDSDGTVSDASDEENDVSVTTGDIIRYNSVLSHALCCVATGQ